MTVELGQTVVWTWQWVEGNPKTGWEGMTVGLGQTVIMDVAVGERVG